MQKLSFRQLKEELERCKKSNNLQKEKIIRAIMKQKLVKYKQSVTKSRYAQDSYADYSDDEDDGSIVFTADDFEPGYGDARNNKQIDTNEDDLNDDYFGPSNRTAKKDDRYKKIQKDDLNNHLLDRMNSDIDINKHRRKKHDFVSPFADDGGDQYASFKGEMPGTISPNDFRGIDKKTNSSRTDRRK
jgi:hypothetical protein